MGLTDWLSSVLLRFLYGPRGTAFAERFAGLLLGLLAPPGLPFRFFERRLADSFPALPAPDAPDAENPRVAGRRRRPAHAPLRAFRTPEQARKFWEAFSKDPSRVPREHTPQLLLLTGEPGEPAPGWDFLLVGDPADAPQGWIEPGFDARTATVVYEGLQPEGFAPILVPSHWQLPSSGLPAVQRDIPIYTNTSYPFDLDPPRAARTGKFVTQPNDRGIMEHKDWMDHDFVARAPRERGPSPAGLYRRAFSLPEGWSPADGRILLVFEGVDACFRAWVDGNFAGFSKDSALAAEFDVTDLLDGSKEEHLLAVEVLKWCDGSYLEDQDKWWLSGIYREVYLVHKPKAAIADYRTRATLAGAKIDFEVLCEGAAPGTHCVRVEVFEGADGGASASSPLAVAVADLQTDLSSPARDAACAIWDPVSCEAEPSNLESPSGARGTIAISSPKPWTAESPNLYTVVITLHSSRADADSGTSPLDAESLRVGFNDVLITPPPRSMLTLNGKPITIGGVNRPEIHPTLGRALSLQIMLDDVRTLRALNINGIRTAHYPSHPLLAELCDQAGIYLCVEGDIETHGFQAVSQPAGVLSDNPEWRNGYLARCARMWARESNHPCVIGWSVGNESGMGRNVQDAADWLRARDGGRRPVQYESGGVLNSATDLIVPMYNRPPQCQSHIDTDPRGRPLVLCEYAHAMGNSGGCMQSYWRMFRQRERTRMQGGYIWDMVDQALLMEPGLPNLPDKFPRDGRKAYGYGGDFGDVPNSGQFCVNGILGPDRVPHPSAREAWGIQSPVGASVKGGAIVIKSWRDFETLADLRIRARCACDAEKDQGGEWAELQGAGDIEAQGEKTFALGRLWSRWSSAVAGDPAALSALLGMSGEDAGKLGEAWVEVLAETREGTVFVPQGTEICRVSLDVAELNEAVAAFVAAHIAHGEAQQAPKADAQLMGGQDKLEVRLADGSSAEIGTACGRLLSWKTAAGTELLAGPLDVCIARASTDNDLGGGPLSYAARWKALGIFNMDRKGRGKDSSAIASAEAFDGGAVVKVAFDLVAPEGVALAGEAIPCTVTYQFLANGDLRVSSIVSPPAHLPPLPRAGVAFAVPKAAATAVTWAGLGPYEAYPDRVSAVRKGIWVSTPEGLYEPYIYPSECGWRAGMRWAALSGPAGRLGIACAARDAALRDGYGFSALPYPLAVLEKARHDWELVTDPDKVFVHVDSRMMGVGGHDSWSPSVDAEFVLPSGAEFVTELVLSPGGEAGARAVRREVAFAA
ncbi:glycosyl hydrolases family 2, TIM barrel domain-containing protein [Hyaloraphidium curvatum]|nr:glycosyl hydrolases family 2, TIM barrel domain-containing protein [Hyaloraphidium curvatum]